MCWPRASRCCAAAASRRSSSCLQQRCRRLQTLREVSCWAPAGPSCPDQLWRSGMVFWLRARRCATTAALRRSSPCPLLPTGSSQVLTRWLQGQILLKLPIVKTCQAGCSLKVCQNCLLDLTPRESLRGAKLSRGREF